VVRPGPTQGTARPAARRTARRAALVVALGASLGSGLGCEPAPPAPDGTGTTLDAGTLDAGPPPVAPPLYASELVSFTPGPGAGFGQDGLPDVVLGPPNLGRGGPGALDVLALGTGGEIVLGFGPRRIVDGPGPDLVVFENPFWVNEDPSMPYAELGEVAVSTDAVSWHSFPCRREGDGAGRFPGCAGWTPTGRYDAFALDPLDPAVVGGDPFDLAELGLSEARYVRVRDLAGQSPPPAAGFDLDAVGAFHLAD
jgi:hypothetical protein